MSQDRCEIDSDARDGIIEFLTCQIAGDMLALEENAQLHAARCGVSWEMAQRQATTMNAAARVQRDSSVPSASVPSASNMSMNVVSRVIPVDMSASSPSSPLLVISREEAGIMPPPPMPPRPVSVVAPHVAPPAAPPAAPAANRSVEVSTVEMCFWLLVCRSLSQCTTQYDLIDLLSMYMCAHP